MAECWRAGEFKTLEIANFDGMKARRGVGFARAGVPKVSRQLALGAAMTA